MCQVQTCVHGSLKFLGSKLLGWGYAIHSIRNWDSSVLTQPGSGEYTLTQWYHDKIISTQRPITGFCGKGRKIVFFWNFNDVQGEMQSTDTPAIFTYMCKFTIK